MEGKLLASAGTQEKLLELIRRYYCGNQTATFADESGISPVFLNGQETGNTFVEYRRGRWRFIRWSA